jgi:hypothetical protein
MMKKTYIQPTTEVIRYHLCQPMLTTSMPLSDTPTGTQFAPEGLFDFDDDNHINTLLFN